MKAISLRTNLHKLTKEISICYISCKRHRNLTSTWHSKEPPARLSCMLQKMWIRGLSLSPRDFVLPLKTNGSCWMTEVAIRCRNAGFSLITVPTSTVKKLPVMIVAVATIRNEHLRRLFSPSCTLPCKEKPQRGQTRTKIIGLSCFGERVPHSDQKRVGDCGVRNPSRNWEVYEHLESY